MKNEKLLLAIGKIDDELIYGAVNDTKAKKKNPWVKWGAMTACLCLVVASVFTVPHLFNDSSLVNDNESTKAYSESEYGKTLGQLLPTTILEGYEICGDGIVIYGKNPAVLQANYYNEALNDMMSIRVAESDYFEDVEYGVIQYGDTKADGSKSSQIYYESDGYTIMFIFSRSNVAEMVGFDEMVHSAPCYNR